MRNRITLCVFCISIMTIIGLSTMYTSNNSLDRIINQDSEKSHVDLTQNKLKKEKDLFEESHSIIDFVIDFVIPVYIDFIHTNINQNNNKRPYLHGEK